MIGVVYTSSELFLRHNKLISLPPDIGFLTALQILDIASNSIRKLPPQIGVAVPLRFLYPPSFLVLIIQYMLSKTASKIPLHLFLQV